MEAIVGIIVGFLFIGWVISTVLARLSPSFREYKTMRDRGETPGLAQQAIRERISRAERDVSQVVRDGFRAGATANQVMQVVLAATAEEPDDDEWRRSLRYRLRMHGLNEIVRVLQADPAKAEEFANFMRERAEQGAVDNAGAAAETQGTGRHGSIRGAT